MNTNPTEPPDESEELVHADDAVIGRAVRWSLMALASIAVVVVIAIVALKRKPAPVPPRVTQIVAPTIPDKSKAEIPVARFTDITKE
ncbi:MAG TPA: hypothetical protein VN887_18410, partial [Candidatus Angelobacter sp.]|nr:hypothetical protein [Candidatus Angelobacter sp.]